MDYLLPGDPGNSTGNGLLLAAGDSWIYNEDDATAIDVEGAFDLEVQINTATGAALGGSLAVTGLDYWNWPDPIAGLSDENLFSSNQLTAFGSGPEDKFEFLFTQNGDMLAPDGETVGVILWAVSIPNFSTPVYNIRFSNNDNGYSDAFYLPEPASILALSVAGLLSVLGRRPLGGR